MIDKNYTELILKAIQHGDQIGGPFELAKILSKSLAVNNGFNEDDLRSRYLTWWKKDAFDTGPTFASVFTKIDKGMEPKLAVETVHLNFGFSTAGCGPAHRCAPLAGFINIPTNKLISIAKEEAKITHFDEDAGFGSGIIVMLCRYLIEGNSLKEAKVLLANDKILQKSWHKVQNAKLSPDGYIFNVLHSALYFIDNNKTIEETIEFAGKANYCPIIYAIIQSCLRDDL
jgi:ADP-ribosyl-[dinitrogen reductase] hydrolase